jgi:peptidyl-prolyl cis-trans isomerase A (cyclophilin A)
MNTKISQQSSANNNLNLLPFDSWLGKEVMLTSLSTLSNVAPNNLTLSNNFIDEIAPLGTIIGNFTTSDPNTGDTFTYSLVSGTGATDNAAFIIENNQLKTNTLFDHETKRVYNIRVRTTDQNGLFFEKVFTVNTNNINEASLPQVISPISDLTVNFNASNTTLNLLTNFDDPATTGKVARFQLYNTGLGDGIINVLLFDQTGAGAPLTVQNFLSYVNAGSYTNSIIHRSVPNFVVQGGGFTVNNLSLGLVPTNPPVQNEFSANRSNIRGTIAMAKVGSNPNSATNQWFFNLADNSSNLNNQNGGFTVFGQVLSQTDLGVINAIANVPVFNGRGISSAFTNLPLNIDPRNPVIDNDDDFVRFREINILSLNELSFSVVSNSNPSLVNASINNNQLLLDYSNTLSGNAQIKVRATNLLGYSIEDTFNITVDPNKAPNNISLSPSSMNENQILGTVIGNFTTSDNDIGNTFTYSLVAGTGGVNNNLFTIIGNQLRSNTVFNWEAANNYSIRVRTTDQDGLFLEKNFVITINNLTENLINGTSENDTLNGNANSNRLDGLEGNDRLNGLAGSDDLYGGIGNDTLNGGTGIDALFGGTGNDDYLIDNKGDRARENINEGIDNVFSTISYTLAANLENLILTGTEAISGTGNNINNQITGNSGNNRINGGIGADTLTGAAGVDTFIFRFGQSQIIAIDSITDFTIGTDKIDLLTSSGQATNAPSNFSRAVDSNAISLLNLVNQVFTDANGTVAGNQALAINSAVLVRVNTAAIAGTYLIINDNADSFQDNNDLLINLTGLTGTLPVFGNLSVNSFFI